MYKVTLYSKNFRKSYYFFYIHLLFAFLYRTIFFVFVSQFR